MTDFRPDDEPAPDIDAELAALEEEILPDDTATIVAEDPAPLGVDLAIDFAEGGLLRTSRGALVKTSGTATLLSWVDIQLHLDRGSCAAMAPGYGLRDAYGGIGEGFASAALANLEERVTEALLKHPRITSLVDFDYDHDPDEEFVVVAFTLVLNDGTELPVETRIT